jgi:hypothetical protein
MPKFKLSSHVTVSAYTEVEADTLEEAIKISERRDVVLGGPGSGAYPDESWIIDDADGAPTDIHHDKD